MVAPAPPGPRNHRTRHPTRDRSWRYLMIRKALRWLSVHVLGESTKPEFIESAPLTSIAAIGYSFGLLSVGTCCWIAFASATTIHDRALNFLYLIVAGTTGWLIGILLSPREPQKEQFNQYIHAIGAFVTGFVLAKAGDIVDLLVRKETVPNDVVIIRTMLFGAMFVITLTWQFASRERLTNYQLQHPELIPSKPKSDQEQSVTVHGGIS
jgi:hypothetical protein